MQSVPNALNTLLVKVRVPVPKPFGGARNTKDLEIFSWDMENYFIATCIPVGKQVTINRHVFIIQQL